MNMSLMLAGANGLMRDAFMAWTSTAHISERCPGASCGGSTNVLTKLGTFDALTEVLNAHPVFSERASVPEALEYLISIQEQATPQIVGGPVSIVKIDREGVHWLQTGACGLAPTGYPIR